MTLREELSQLFDYDHWAARRLMPVAGEVGLESVLLHCLQSQIIWLARIEGRQPWTPSWENFALDSERSVRGWQRLLHGADLGQVVAYVNSSGQALENTILEITRHVINHGTYHRGHIRGVAEMRGFEFPDTDYILYCRERSRASLV